ncbi:hypothetical protein KSF_098920 [Reticulibacter mediterranei]|uniref:Uncharacterized protein n=1 Tax=Reticulibacter mediterranei TaxID=2778369 RepID=A0A8J3IXQ8_9CHLR|nr:hypothetical protein [Reticulibacter mediterranei]GHO99844.1 hypothetical protein KSF_098920 [Reticulibacter mediterranei]
MSGKSKNTDGRTPEEVARGDAPKTEHHRSYLAIATLTVQDLTVPIYEEFETSGLAQDKPSATRLATTRLMAEVESKLGRNSWGKYGHKAKVTCKQVKN